MTRDLLDMLHCGRGDQGGQLAGFRRSQCDEYRARLNRAATARSTEEIAALGKAITTLESVPTALVSLNARGSSTTVFSVGALRIHGER